MNSEMNLNNPNVMFLKGGSYGIREADFKFALNKIIQFIKTKNIRAIIWDGDPLPVVEYVKDLGFANLLPYLKARFPYLQMIAVKGVADKAKEEKVVKELITSSQPYSQSDIFGSMPYLQSYQFFKDATCVINVNPTSDETVDIDGIILNKWQVDFVQSNIIGEKNLLILTPKWKYNVLGLNVMKLMKHIGIDNAILVTVAGGSITESEKEERVKQPELYPIVEDDDNISFTFDRIPLLETRDTSGFASQFSNYKSINYMSLLSFTIIICSIIIQILAYYM